MSVSDNKFCFRQSLCADKLIATVYHQFQKIPDPRGLSKSNSMSFIDILMAGFAVFGLKFPSLLQYDQVRETLDSNIKNLYRVNYFPSDSYLRERLDELDPCCIRPTFKKIFAKMQRGKCLEKFVFLDGYYLLSIDGTGEFSSGKVCCKQCCKKEHKDGSVTFYHQMLGACIVHPDQSNVIPFCSEVIQNGDGHEKNDCERNAAKRFVENFRREHPHLKVIITGDGITSNAPYIRLLEENRFKYLLGAKSGDHKFLFKTIEASERTEYWEFTDNQGFFHQFRYLNKVTLNMSSPDLLVNFLEYRQTDPKGKETNFSWVTNIQITQNNIFSLVQGGRARWKIENETFNTLKNLGYNFEHNYGHGKKYLCTNFCLLMMLAFFIDQVQGIACSLFQRIRKKAGSYRRLWETFRVLFQFMSLLSWEDLYRRIAVRYKIDTS